MAIKSVLMIQKNSQNHVPPTQTAAVSWVQMRMYGVIRKLLKRSTAVAPPLLLKMISVTMKISVASLANFMHSVFARVHARAGIVTMVRYQRLTSQLKVTIQYAKNVQFHLTRITILLVLVTSIASKVTSDSISCARIRVTFV